MDKTIWQGSDSDRLIHQLYQTMRLFSKTLNQEIADTGIYSSEWTILNLIHHREDCAQTALSQYLGVEPAAISKTLTKMEKKG
ncbi:MAG: MarR family transcriptional regulator, partial [Mitsuokella jalaludinii]|nr:MarR family transcriptional regulator [Mitsuokella jalaludinii]